MTTAWLIEHTSYPTWWTGRRGATLFSTDANEAVRFVRKEDAERVAGLIIPQASTKVTEHMWYDEAAGPEPVASPWTPSGTVWRCKAGVERPYHSHKDGIYLPCSRPDCNVGGLAVDVIEPQPMPTGCDRSGGEIAAAERTCACWRCIVSTGGTADTTPPHAIAGNVASPKITPVGALSESIADQPEARHNVEDQRPMVPHDCRVGDAESAKLAAHERTVRCAICWVCKAVLAAKDRRIAELEASMTDADNAVRELTKMRDELQEANTREVEARRVQEQRAVQHAEARNQQARRAENAEHDTIRQMKRAIEAEDGRKAEQRRADAAESKLAAEPYLTIQRQHEMIAELQAKLAEAQRAHANALHAIKEEIKARQRGLRIIGEALKVAEAWPTESV
jgi:hypothetical protein